MSGTACHIALSLSIQSLLLIFNQIVSDLNQNVANVKTIKFLYGCLKALATFVE